LLLHRPDGSTVQAIWAGSAQEEKLGWWQHQPGNELVQSEPVAAIAIQADDDKEMTWGDTPDQARLIFVLCPSPPEKDYRLARLVTTAATPAQFAHFRHPRFALFGTLWPDGGIHRIPPLEPPPPRAPAQRTLF